MSTSLAPTCSASLPSPFPGRAGVSGPDGEPQVPGRRWGEGAASVLREVDRDARRSPAPPAVRSAGDSAEDRQGG